MRRDKQNVRLVVFIGPPGSGKGTHSKKLHNKIKENKSLLIETRALLDRQKNREMRRMMAAGKIVPDPWVIKVVGKSIAESPHPLIILDGFPRTAGQSLFFTNEGPSRLGIERVILVELSLDDEVCLKRMDEKRKVGSHKERPDDSPQIRKDRLKVYRENLPAVLDPLIKAGAIHLSIEPKGSEEETHKAIAESVLPLLKQSSGLRFDPAVSLVP